MKFAPAMLMLILIAGGHAAGQEAAKAPPATLTVAILDFAAKDPGNPDLGREIADALGALLSGEPGFTLVDRSAQERALQEQALNLTGLVDAEQAVKIGKIVGAKIIVTGRVFNLGQQTYIVAKLIGTETSLLESVTAKGAADADLGELTMELSQSMAGKLRDSGPKLVARPDTVPDPLPGLRDELSKRRRPVMAVIVREQHRAAPATVTAGRTPDPAVETELKRLLIASGFIIKDVPQNDLAGFARDWTPENLNAWPRSMAAVDVLIVGEGFSEFAARIGNLVSSSARAEINAIDRKTGRIVHAARTTTRAADLSEHIAAKTALEKAGYTLGIGLLREFAQSLPLTEPKPED